MLRLIANAIGFFVVIGLMAIGAQTLARRLVSWKNAFDHQAMTRA